MCLAVVAAADVVGVLLGYALQVVEPRAAILRVAWMVETGVLARQVSEVGAAKGPLE